MDDVFNYLPSRVSAVLMIAAAFLTGMDAKKAAQIYKRDRRKHASPNSLRRRNQSVRGASGAAGRRCMVFWCNCIKRDDRRSDPSRRGRRHQTGRKADVCDQGCLPCCLQE